MNYWVYWEGYWVYWVGCWVYWVGYWVYWVGYWVYWVHTCWNHDTFYGRCRDRNEISSLYIQDDFWL